MGNRGSKNKRRGGASAAMPSETAVVSSSGSDLVPSSAASSASATTVVHSAAGAAAMTTSSPGPTISPAGAKQGGISPSGSHESFGPSGRTRIRSSQSSAAVGSPSPAGLSSSPSRSFLRRASSVRFPPDVVALLTARGGQTNADQKITLMAFATAYEKHTANPVVSAEIARRFTEYCKSTGHDHIHFIGFLESQYMTKNPEKIPAESKAQHANIAFFLGTMFSEHQSKGADEQPSILPEGHSFHYSSGRQIFADDKLMLLTIQSYLKAHELGHPDANAHLRTLLDDIKERTEPEFTSLVAIYEKLEANTNSGATRSGPPRP